MVPEQLQFNTRDIVYMAIFGALFAVWHVFVPWSDLWVFLPPPLGGAWSGGLPIIFYTLCWGLTKRDLTPFFAGIIASVVEIALGNPKGAIVFFLNLMEGGGVSIGFLIFAAIKRYKDSLPAWCLAGAIGSALWMYPFYAVMGFLKFYLVEMVIAAIILAAIAGIIFAGILGIYVNKVLIQAGVPARELEKED
jgi:ABC-type thiamin/hydroxymethylpyrimidine transport system permease subunit